MPPAAAELNRKSFLPGDTVRLTLHLGSSFGDLDAITNVSVDFFRVERERNQFAFGFGSTPKRSSQTELTVSQTIPMDFRVGLYFVQRVIITFGDEVGRNEVVWFEPVFFAIQNVLEQRVDQPRLQRMVRDMEVERSRYVNAPIKTEAIQNTHTPPKSFRVLIFGVGCLIHGYQQLEGYCVRPLGMGLTHSRMHEIVNAALTDEGLSTLPFMQETESQFARSTPTFLVSYASVLAIDHVDALEHCRSHSALLFQILGLDRGQMPREFACMAAEMGTSNQWHLFHLPGYRGNLIADFNPAATGNQIERLLPRLQGNPFGRLIVSTFADATAEQDLGFALLRCWAVLELIADRKIPRNGTRLQHPDGTAILNSKGNPETTNSKLGRVYSYILSTNAFRQQGASALPDGTHQGYSVGNSRWASETLDKSEHFPLWDIVAAAYMIRNAVAHEGRFDPEQAAAGEFHEILASRLVRIGPVDLFSFVKEQARMVLWREI